VSVCCQTRVMIYKIGNKALLYEFGERKGGSTALKDGSNLWIFPKTFLVFFFVFTLWRWR